MLLFVLGAVVAQQVAFGGYLDYVKPAQGPWLLAGGLVLGAFGLVGMPAAPGRERERPVLTRTGRWPRRRRISNGPVGSGGRPTAPSTARRPASPRSCCCRW